MLCHAFKAKVACYGSAYNRMIHFLLVVVLMYLSHSWDLWQQWRWQSTPQKEITLFVIAIQVHRHLSGLMLYQLWHLSHLLSYRHLNMYRHL